MPYSTFTDVPFSIKTEGETIKLKFNQSVPTDSQGTIEWSIPAANADCSLDKDKAAYSGMLLIVDDKPIQPDSFPIDGIVYSADSTVNRDLHAGDKIGTSLVIGAIYECDKKGQSIPLTNTLVINDLEKNKPYYIAGFAVDCQNRYHTEGVRAYSSDYGRPNSPNTPAKQVISFNPGIKATDGTNLQVGTLYSFDIAVNSSLPERTEESIFTVTVDGIEAGTYQSLIDTINKKLLLIDNPPTSILPPNYGLLYWDESKRILYTFDGTNHNKISNLFIEASDPSDVSSGEYWFNSIPNEVKQYDGNNWTLVNVIDYGNFNPIQPEYCGLYWVNSQLGKIFKGSENRTWCELTSIIQSDCPSTNTVSCGTYWFNGENLYVRDNETWIPVSALMWDMPPNNLANGTYWFDLTNNVLNQLLNNQWVDASAIISTTEPSLPAPNTLWFHPIDEVLRIWDNSSSDWLVLQTIVWKDDPTNVGTCDLWWNVTNNNLYKWDVVHNEWDNVTLYDTLNDPTTSNTFDVGTAWFDDSTNTLYIWDGVNWQPTDYINNQYDPFTPNIGDVWIDNNTDVYIWDGTVWVLTETIDSSIDPTTIPDGWYWYDTSTNKLFQRSSGSWQEIVFSTTPLTPNINQQYFNTQTDTLYVWNGSEWVIDNGKVHASINDQGCIEFVTTATGSNVGVVVIDPRFDEAAYGTPFELIKLPIGNVDPEYFLFSNLQHSNEFIPPIGGGDGLSGTPSYAEIGVGTDGTPDERRELIDSIRRQLGHPTVTVELTKYQLDTAVQAALESFRKRSSSAYKRGFFFLDLMPRQQQYLMTNKALGYNKITNVNAIYRFTSAFMSTAHGGGVYGQVVLQHLYNMGTYDLTSYHLVAQYVEQLRDLFATNIVFSWNEYERLLTMHQMFNRRERVLLDCTVERTEQDLLTDRFAKSWLERYALSESMIMLAQIRGKYATLPGAGGGISMNAADLMTTAESYRAELLEQIDDYVAQAPEDIGIGSTFIIG